MVGAGGRREGRRLLQLVARRAHARGEARLRRPRHERAPPERLRVHVQPEPVRRDPRAAHAGPGLRRRRHRAARRDARRDAADPHRRGVRDARLHQRRPARRRPAARARVRRRRLLQRHADRAARALARGDRPPHQGVDGEGVLRLERQALPVPQGQPVAAADPGSAPAALDPRRGVVVDLGLLPRPRHPVRLPQLLRRQVRTGGDGPLLGPGGGERPRPQPVPRARSSSSSASPTPTRRPRSSSPSTSSTSTTSCCTARRSTSRPPATATTRACSTSSSRGSSSSPT